MAGLTLFVDESGQSGIKRIQSASNPGASKYMTLGGVLIPNSKLDEYRTFLASLCEKFSKPSLHCSKLNHNEICRFAQDAASLDLTTFGVISLKTTLGDYKSEIKGNDKLYYNKCAQYLLERVGMCLDEMGLSEDDLSISFEEGNFEYAKLRALISRCRSNPIRPQTRYLKHVNPHAIRSDTKEEEALLQFSDLVAHALFRCVDDSPRAFGIRETRYLSELKSRFFSQKPSGKVLGKGIFCVHSLSDIKATPPVHTFLNNLISS